MGELVYCKYCNQMITIDCPPEATQEEKQIMAIECCECIRAQNESERLKELTRARVRIEELFGESSTEIGFEAIESNKVHDLLNEIAELVSNKRIKSTTINITNETKAKVSISKEGKINVERTETTKYKL